MKLFVKSESNSRGDLKISHFKMDLSLIEKAQELRHAYANDKIGDGDVEEVLDELCKDNNGLIEILNEIIFHSYMTITPLPDYVDDIKTKGWFGIELEESIYGVGTTKDNAISGFNSVQYEEDDWDDEEE